MTHYSDPPTANQLRQDCDQLLAAYNALDQTRQQAIQALDALKQTGIYDSIPTASYEKRRENGGKALRLIFPTQNGERIREYIGTAPDAQAQALAQIERTQEARELDRLIEDIGRDLKRYAADLSRKAKDVTYSAQYRDTQLEKIKLEKIKRAT